MPVLEPAAPPGQLCAGALALVEPAEPRPGGAGHIARYLGAAAHASRDSDSGSAAPAAAAEAMT